MVLNLWLWSFPAIQTLCGHYGKNNPSMIQTPDCDYMRDYMVQQEAVGHYRHDLSAL